MKIGIRAESTGLPLRPALAEASKLGVGGVQLDATGDLSPDRLSQTGRREVRNLLRSHNLDLTALSCPLRRGLDDAENQQARIERITAALTLSYDLGARIAIVEGPRIPDPEKDADRANRLREALTALGRHGDRIGATLALETGLESGARLKAYLDSFDVGSLAANYDPANMLLNGFDPAAEVAPLRGRIAHTHARDVRQGGASRTAQEVALGAGDVNWLAYIAALAAVEYRGWLVVERESGDRKLADVADGVAFLRRLVR
jgi:sugar phosphate isomerase/epimerase